MSLKLSVDYREKISKLISEGIDKKGLDDMVQAGGAIVQNEYKKQSPTNSSRLKNNVYNRKDGVGKRLVSTSAGRYATYLHEGTGRLKGARDYGYTTGRVRANEVAWGIGGIRPNKFADRTIKVTAPLVSELYVKTIDVMAKKMGYTNLTFK